MVTALAVAPLDAGDAWFEADDDRPVHGSVCGVFSRVFYLRFGDRILALCRADVASGPLHLRLAALPAVGLGDPAVFEAGRLQVGSTTVTLRADRRWGPQPVSVAALTKSVGVRHPSRLPRDPGIGQLRDLPAVRDLVAERDLEALARLVGGRGPGLTPAGDDFLAGVLIIDALLHPGEPAPRRAAVEAVTTTDVAAAFLRWAALGQCIQPVHDVVSAISTGQPAGEAEARAGLRATGASSGQALLLGLDVALSAS